MKTVINHDQTMQIINKKVPEAHIYKEATNENESSEKKHLRHFIIESKFSKLNTVWVQNMKHEQN